MIVTLSEVIPNGTTSEAFPDGLASMSSINICHLAATPAGFHPSALCQVSYHFLPDVCSFSISSLGHDPFQFTFILFTSDRVLDWYLASHSYIHFTFHPRYTSI